MRGNGSVYKVFSAALAGERFNLPKGAEVAYKLLDSFSDDARERLRNELTHLKHFDDIDGIYDLYGEHEIKTRRGRVPGIVVELADRSLHDWILEQEDEEEAEEVMAQIVEPLARIHERGYVHRDLKPKNILLFGDRFKLGDFGSAGRVDDHRKYQGISSATTTLLHSTRVFMAPECFEPVEGSYLASRQSDIYSVAVIAHMLHGGTLFSDLGSTQLNAAKHDLSELEQLVDEVELPGTKRDAILVALNPDPRERPESATAFLKAFTYREDPRDGLYQTIDAILRNPERTEYGAMTRESVDKMLTALERMQEHDEKRGESSLTREAHDRVAHAARKEYGILSEYVEQVAAQQGAAVKEPFEKVVEALSADEAYPEGLQKVRENGDILEAWRAIPNPENPSETLYDCVQRGIDAVAQSVYHQASGALAIAHTWCNFEGAEFHDRERRLRADEELGDML